MLEEGPHVLFVGDSWEVLDQLVWGHLLSSLHEHDHVHHTLVISTEQLMGLKESSKLLLGVSLVDLLHLMGLHGIHLSSWDLGLGSWLLHSWLMHAWLLHAWLVHTWLLHAWLVHTWLLHAWLVHTWLLHAWLLHTWLVHTRLCSMLLDSHLSWCLLDNNLG